MFSTNFDGFMLIVERILDEEDRHKISNTITSFEQKYKRTVQSSENDTLLLIEFLGKLNEKLGIEKLRRLTSDLNNFLPEEYSFDRSDDGRIYYRVARSTNSNVQTRSFSLHLVASANDTTINAPNRMIEPEPTAHIYRPHREEGSEADTRRSRNNNELQMKLIEGKGRGKELHSDTEERTTAIQKIRAQIVKMREKEDELTRKEDEMKKMDSLNNKIQQSKNSCDRSRECEAFQRARIGVEEENLMQKAHQQLEELQSVIKCSICLETLEDPHIIPDCGHRFCKKCINESMRKGNNQCPECRHIIRTKRHLREDQQSNEMISTFHNLMQILNDNSANKYNFRNPSTCSGASSSNNAATTDDMPHFLEDDRLVKEYSTKNESTFSHTVAARNSSTLSLDHDPPSYTGDHGNVDRFKDINRSNIPRRCVTSSTSADGLTSNFDSSTFDIFQSQVAQAQLDKNNILTSENVSTNRTSIKGMGLNNSKDCEKKRKRAIAESSNKRTKKMISNEERFTRHVEEMRQYIEEHNTSYVAESCPLAKWSHRMRQSYSLLGTGKKPPMFISDNRIEQLNSIHFDWAFKTKEHSPGFSTSRKCLLDLDVVPIIGGPQRAHLDTAYEKANSKQQPMRAYCDTANSKQQPMRAYCDTDCVKQVTGRQIFQFCVKLRSLHKNWRRGGDGGTGILRLASKLDYVKFQVEKGNCYENARKVNMSKTRKKTSQNHETTSHTSTVGSPSKDFEDDRSIKENRTKSVISRSATYHSGTAENESLNDIDCCKYGFGKIQVEHSQYDNRPQLKAGNSCRNLSSHPKMYGIRKRHKSNFAEEYTRLKRHKNKSHIETCNSSINKNVIRTKPQQEDARTLQKRFKKANDNKVLSVYAEAAFDRNVEAMKNYMKKYRTSYVKKRENKSLYNWSYHARNAFISKKAGIVLNERRRKKLDSIGFEWGHMERDVKASSGSSKSTVANTKPAAFFKERGHPTTVSRLNECVSGLGAKPGTNQLDNKSRKGPQLTRFNNAYKRNIAKLRRWNTIPGPLCLNNNTDKNLSNYCSKLRRLYRDRQSGTKEGILKLTDARVEELESLGFDWESRNPILKPDAEGRARTSRAVVLESEVTGRHQKNFKNNYKRRILELRKWKANRDPLCMNFSADRNLTEFCKKIRIKYRDQQSGTKKCISRITDKMIEDLESLGFDWEYGKPYLKLNEEINHGRSLPEEEIRDLDTSIEFVTDLDTLIVGKSQDINFNNAYVRNIAKLRRWNTIPGPMCLNSNTDRNLSKFCSKLRRLYRDRQSGTEEDVLRMTDARVEELESLGFDWESRKPYLKLNEAIIHGISLPAGEEGGLDTTTACDTETPAVDGMGEMGGRSEPKAMNRVEVKDLSKLELSSGIYSGTLSNLGFLPTLE